MRVAIDISQAIYGTGVSDYTLELSRRIPATLFGYSLRRQSEIRRLFPTARIFPFPPTLIHLLWNQLHTFTVENLLGKVDVYHSSDWAQAPSRARKVTTIHDLAPILYPSPTITPVHQARLRWVVKECDRIICVSKFTEVELHRLYPSTFSRTVVIPEALPSRFLHEPMVINSEPYVLAIGARQPRKNISRLISAFLKYRPAEKLIIVGENSSIINHKSIIYTGYVSDQDLVNYLAGAKCFVYPSLYEGFGLPILGAFHHKIPVACSDISVFHETAGDAVKFFDPNNEESISKGIVDAIQNKTRLTNLGAEQLRNYSWEIVAKDTLNVYKSLC